MEKVKVLCIVQARLTSSRLPNKVFKLLQGKSIIELLYERLLQAKTVDKIVFAIPDNQENAALYDYLVERGIETFKGSELDVFDRFLQCGKKYNPDWVVRATCDNPLVDWTIIDKLVLRAQETNSDYCFIAGYPIGTVSRVFNFHTFEAIDKSTLTDLEIEHVTPVFYNHPEQYKVNIENATFDKFRLTVDTEEDYKLMTKIYDALYDGTPILNEKVYEYLKENPELCEINKHIEQVKA
jgi:spore coat polysaccharide biosynthesis protein SpsF